jgi:hypothetical protein
MEASISHAFGPGSNTIDCVFLFRSVIQLEDAAYHTIDCRFSRQHRIDITDVLYNTLGLSDPLGGKNGSWALFDNLQRTESSCNKGKTISLVNIQNYKLTCHSSMMY